MDIAFRRHISSLSIGAVTFKFPNHDAIFAALNQIEINLLGMEKACPSDAFECNLVAAAGAAPFLIIQRPMDGDFLFTIGTIAGFGASLFVMVENVVFGNCHFIHPSAPVLGKRRRLCQVTIPSVGLSFVPLLQLFLADFKLVVEQVGKAAVF